MNCACGGSCGCGAPIIINPNPPDTSPGAEAPSVAWVTFCDTNGAFLRRITTDPAGTVTVEDFDLDGTTPYTPVGDVRVCAGGEPGDESPGSPGSVGPEGCAACQTLVLCDTIPEEVSPGEGTEVDWALTGVDPDPASDPGRGYLFHLSPVDDPSQTATVRVTSNTVANTVCPPATPGDIVFNNTNDLVFELDDTAQTASYLRVDLQDFDTFEPVQIHADSPEPSRLGGTAGWNADHTQIVPATDNGTGEMYWDAPPATFGYRIWNTGGGTSCSRLSFAMATIVPPDTPPGTQVAHTFLRTICRDCDGTLVSVADTDLDGTTPYTPVGTPTACTAGGGGVEPDSPGPGGPDVVACETGNALLVKLCTDEPTDESPGPACEVSSTFQVCRCDDVNGDGTDVVCYTEVWAVGCDGGPPTLVVAYTDDPATAYTPVNPVPCSDLSSPSESASQVQAHRVSLTEGATWDAAAHPLLQSVTITNVDGGPSSITTIEGASVLWPGESVTYSVQKDADVLLVGPLSVAAGAGSTVTVAWTELAVAP